MCTSDRCTVANAVFTRVTAVLKYSLFEVSCQDISTLRRYLKRQAAYKQQFCEKWSTGPNICRKGSLQHFCFVQFSHSMDLQLVLLHVYHRTLQLNVHISSLVPSDHHTLKQKPVRYYRV